MCVCVCVLAGDQIAPGQRLTPITHLVVWTGGIRHDKAAPVLLKVYLRHWLNTALAICLLARFFFSVISQRSHFICIHVFCVHPAVSVL